MQTESQQTNQTSKSYLMKIVLTLLSFWVNEQLWSKEPFIKYLQSSNSCTLESQISFEVLGNFSHQSLEWEFPDKQLGGLLVSSDFSQGNCSRPVSVRFFDTTGWWSTLSCSLCGQLFSWSLTSCRLSSCLFSTSHALPESTQDMHEPMKYAKHKWTLYLTEIWES